jgi:hypothetical protein
MALTHTIACENFSAEGVNDDAPSVSGLLLGLSVDLRRNWYLQHQPPPPPLFRSSLPSGALHHALLEIEEITADGMHHGNWIVGVPSRRPSMPAQEPLL